ncbi:hypothetical protein IJJ08_01935 [bacterium]|nr:hypothetical protein [bacterium]
MNKFGRRLAAIAVSVVLVLGGLSAAALPEVAQANEAVGSPHTGQVDYEYFYDLRAIAGKKDTAVIKNYSNFGIMINILAVVLTIASGVLFFFLILTAGYQLVFAGGKEEALRSAKKRLTTGIVGMLIVISAYWIAQILVGMTGMGT